MTIPCSLELNQKLLRITAANGRTIAEILVEGPFENCLRNAITSRPIEKGVANIYRGELMPLESHEYLDVHNQEIINKKENI